MIHSRHFSTRQGPRRCRVETYSGFRLHERPRRFTWSETWLEVDRVINQWRSPGFHWFEVRVGDRDYLLKYDESQDHWEAGLIEPQNRPGG